jgi:uncharacterized integral membrane protein
MIATRLKGYVLTVFSGLVLLGGFLLLALQWGNEGNFSLYGKSLPSCNTGVVMLGSMAGGLLLPWLVKTLVRGVSAIRKARKSAKIEQSQG